MRLFPLLVGLGGTAILVSLGIWQVQRLDWKTAAINRIEARISQAPVPLPAAPTEAADNYRAVRAEGEVGPAGIYVFTTRNGTPGYRVIAPFETLGRTVMLDRGFIRQGAHGADLPTGPASITGNLWWPDEFDRLFTPEPDGDIWFARQVPRMAEALGTQPVMIALRDGLPGTEPMPVTANLSNNHLSYAVQWFGLAIVWAAMTVYLMRRRR